MADPDMEKMKTAMREVFGMEPGQVVNITNMERSVTNMERTVTNMERTVATNTAMVSSLVGNTPTVAIRNVSACVLGKGTHHEDDALINGASTTWSIMKHGNRFFAVSAAHCSLDYKMGQNSDQEARDQPRKFFLEIPEQVAGMVQSAYLLPNIITSRSNRRLRCSNDFVALRLTGLPSDITNPNVIPTWDEVTKDTSVRGTIVGGTALSGPVTGWGCAWEDEKDESGSYLVFTQDSGEPGNSGTFMFNTQATHAATGHPMLLGIDVAGKNPRKSNARGYICPTPRFEDLIEYAAVIEGSIRLRKKHKRRRKPYFSYICSSSEPNCFKCTENGKADIFGVVVVAPSGSRR